MSGFLLIIFSALMHSLWNIILKKSNNKYLFNYQMHFLNFCIMTFVYIIFFREYLYYDPSAVAFAFFSALFFTGYHLFLSTSYRYADASMVYPVTTSSPVWVALWATIFLQEKITILGLLGIIITLIGVLIINSSKASAFKMDKGIIFAFISAFFYSVGAIVDKLGVGVDNFILYVYSLTFFMTLFMYLYSARRFTNHTEHFVMNIKYLISGSLILFLSFFVYRVGLILVQVSYATALRQVNALFGVLFGVLFLKEKFSYRRLVGSVIIFIGVMIIRAHI